ncbi:hypothetical protein STEG23_011725, partial [Scotinomys teguina]
MRKTRCSSYRTHRKKTVELCQNKAGQSFKISASQKSLPDILQTQRKVTDEHCHKCQPSNSETGAFSYPLKVRRYFKGRKKSLFNKDARTGEAHVE